MEYISHVKQLFLLTYILVSTIVIAQTEVKQGTIQNINTVITEEDIKKMQVNSMVELLNQIPGVTATDSGIRFRGSSAKHILVLLDGRELADPTSSHSAINWEQVSVNSIKKIEILKGSGSVLYGENSSGGVINITTKKSGRGNQLNLRASYGRFNSQKYDINYQNNIDNFGFAIYPGYRASDGYRVNSSNNTKRIGGKVSYKLSSKTRIALLTNYSNEERRASGPLYYPTPSAYSGSDIFGISFIVSSTWIKGKTHLNNYSRKYDNPDRDISNRLRSQTINQELSSTISLPEIGKLNFGINLEFANVQGNKIEGTHSENKYAAYFTKDINFMKIPLQMNIGLRANIYTEFSSTINPQIQLSYQLSNLNMFFSVNTASNIPDYYKRFFGSTVTKPNPFLKMEKALNYSLRFSYPFGKWVESEVTFFFSKLTNQLSRVIYDTIATYKNVGSAVKNGIEFSTAIKPNELWQINTSYTYLIAKDLNSNNILPYSPKHKFDINLNYKPFHSTSFSLNAKYFSNRFVNLENTKALGGTHIAIDLKLNWTITKNFTFILTVSNLLNKYYEWGYGYPYSPRGGTIGIIFEIL